MFLLLEELPCGSALRITCADKIVTVRNDMLLTLKADTNLVMAMVPVVILGKARVSSASR